jgi:hypothetical protein
MKFKVFLSNSIDNIKWLVIESDEADTQGYFVYYHLDANNAFDTWHKTIEDAFEAVFNQYGIQKNNWDKIE